MLKKIFASLLSMSLVFVFTQKSYAVKLPGTLSPTIRQLFLDKAKEITDERIKNGKSPRPIEEEAGWLVFGNNIVIAGKQDGENLTKLTTEDINSLGSLRCDQVTFCDCDLTEANLDGLFDNYSLIDLDFLRCKPSKREIKLKLTRDGWDWWELGTFHKMCVGIEYYH